MNTDEAVPELTDERLNKFLRALERLSWSNAGWSLKEGEVIVAELRRLREENAALRGENIVLLPPNATYKIRMTRMENDDEQR